jgi:hypothetical protein
MQLHVVYLKTKLTDFHLLPTLSSIINSYVMGPRTRTVSKRA